MRGRRRQRTARDLPPQPAGHCCYCGEKIPAGSRRTRWCSQVCVDQFRTQHDPQYVRWQLLERDGGICHTCGLRAADLEYGLWWLQYMIVRPDRLWSPPLGFCFGPANDYLSSRVLRQSRAYQDLVKSLKITFKESMKSLWEGHHVEALAEGGLPPKDLSGYQTLCIWCHKAETAALTNRRAR